MKTKMKQNKMLSYRVFLFVVFGAICFALQAKDYEFEKRYNKSYPANEILKLDIDNKHGDVVIKDDGSETVTIEVVVKVESKNSREGQNLLDDIDIDIRKESKVVYAHTSVKKQKGFQFLKNKLKINYTINVPADIPLKVKNYYGDISIDKLKAEGEIEAKYGALYAGELSCVSDEKTRVYVGYGKGEIEKVSTVKVDVEYSKMEIGEGEFLELDCQYSGVDLGRFKQVDVDAQFNGVNINYVDVVDAHTNYAGLQIGTLTTSLRARSSFGGVSVERVLSSFEDINVYNSYGSIKLGLASDTNFFVDLSAGYGGISIPDDWNLNTNKGMNSKEVRGNVGSASDKKVELDVSFGSIKLWEE